MSANTTLNRDRLRDPARQELSAAETTEPMLYHPGSLWSIPPDAIAPLVGAEQDYSASARSRLEG